MTHDAEVPALLTSERERMNRKVVKLEADLRSLTTARRSQSDDDEHDPEGETLSAQWSMLAGLLGSARDDARQADEAMKRFEAGTYGVCVTCLEPIPQGQLEVRPLREQCVPCAS